ncbi:MAG: hypothetical protein NVV62_01030 [Terricaulis sp.]|nr:hypothetical protein [Terricaulis sp.]
MTELNALLKRSFAEIEEPADDGFTVKIGHAVARREASAVLRNRVYAGAMLLAGLAVFYGVYALVQALGPQIMAMFGLEIAQAYGAIASGPSATGQGILQSLGAGMTQLLLITGALAGGLATFRAVRQG